MFAPLIFGALLNTHQAQKVSFELRGVRLENAAPLLAKTLGFSSLDIGPTLKNEVLLIRAKEVEPTVLRDKIAQALNATWENRPEGWRLTQSDDQKAAEQKIYNTERYKFYSELVEKSKKRISQMKPFDEANCKQILKDLDTISKTRVNRNGSNNVWRKISAIDQQSPTSRLALRMALRITPDVFMKLTEQNPRIIFCSKPNAMQQAFPFHFSDLIDQTMQEQNQWSTYAAGEPLRGPSAGIGDDDGWYSLGNLNDKRQPYKTSDFYMVTMSLELNEQSLYINGYDQKGHRTFQSNINFYDYEDGDGQEAYNYREEIEKLKRKMVKLQGDALEYADLVAPIDYMEVQRRRGQRKDLSPSLLEKVLNPEKVDPLSISAPDVYFTAIETPNIVMVLNDNQRASRFAEFKEAAYRRYTGAKFSDENGWFLYSSSNPVATRRTMPDRKKLGPILRFIYKNQRPLTIEEQAALAISLPWENDLTWSYKSHMDVLKTNEIENYNDRNGLRIYGTLTDAQIQTAKKVGIPLSSLSEDTRRELFRAIYYSRQYEGRIEMDYSGMEKMSEKEQKEFYEMQELLWGGIYEEKTFALPSGLTNNLMLTIEDNSQSTLYCGRPPANGEEDYYGGGRAMTANSLGQYLFKATNPTRYKWEVDRWNRVDENDIRLATQRNMNIKLKISPQLHFSWGLGQTLITDPKTYTAKTLPQSVLDEVTKGYKEAEKYDKEYGSHYDNQGGGGGRKNNPPPRI
jgi:hypothetical protein